MPRARSFGLFDKDQLTLSSGHAPLERRPGPGVMFHSDHGSQGEFSWSYQDLGTLPAFVAAGVALSCSVIGSTVQSRSATKGLHEWRDQKPRVNDRGLRVGATRGTDVITLTPHVRVAAHGMVQDATLPEGPP
jgi:hypothetical protein